MDIMPLQHRQDSEKFGQGFVDNTVKSESESGYVHTRPRTTRKVLRTIKTGFTELSQAEADEFDTFYQAHGTFQSFDYTHPTKGGVIKVRFQSPIEFHYVGKGGNHKYTIDQMVLIEV